MQVLRPGQLQQQGAEVVHHVLRAEAVAQGLVPFKVTLYSHGVYKLLFSQGYVCMYGVAATVIKLGGESVEYNVRSLTRDPPALCLYIQIWVGDSRLGVKAPI